RPGTGGGRGERARHSSVTRSGTGTNDVALCYMPGLIEYELAGADLGEVRFALSPMNEVALSLRTWREPGRYPLMLPWLNLTAAARSDLDGELLLALTNDNLWTPDFLTPRP